MLFETPFLVGSALDLLIFVIIIMDIILSLYLG